MIYYNQTNYRHVPYPTLTDLPELGCAATSVRDAGCGLCATSMVIENMTGQAFPLIDCLELSINVHANHSPGTDLTILGTYAAERFNLNFEATDDDDGEHIRVLDQSQVPGKYDIEGRREKVIVNGNILHTTMEVLAKDCRYREPKYYADGDFKKWLEFAGEPANRMRYFLFRPSGN